VEDALPGASATIVVDDLSLAGPGVKLEKLSGKIQAGFQPGKDGGEYTLQSAFSAQESSLAGLRALGARVTWYATGSVQMQNGETKLLSPEIGAAVHLAGLRGRGIECGRASFQGRIAAGEEPVPIGSPGLLVPSLTASFGLASGGARVGSVQVTPGTAKVWMSAQGLNLAGQRWRTGMLSGKLDLDLGRVVAGAVEIDRPQVTADLRAESLTSDQRFRRPARLFVRVRSGAAKTDSFSVQAVDARLGARLRSLTPVTLPLTLNAAADGLILGGGKFPIPRQVKLDFASLLDVRGGVLAVERLEAGLGDLIALEASGRFAWQEGRGEVVFGIRPFSIERALVALPGDMGKGWPALKGELEIKGKTEVILPDGGFDLERLKHTTEATLFLRGVQGVLSDAGFRWTDLSGRLKLTALGTGLKKTTVDANLTVGKLRVGSSTDLSGVSIACTARRDGEDFSLDGRIAASKLDAAGLLTRPLANSQVEFYGQLAGTKELRLKYVKVALPSLGADLSVGGRFVRNPGAGGLDALRMSAKVEAGLHSPAPVPLPGGWVASGEGSLSISVESGSDGVLAAQGSISFDGLNVKGANFELKGIRGSIPVSQIVATRPGLGLLAERPGGEKKKEAATAARSRAYEEALLPMKGRQRSFSIDGVRYEDLQLAHLTGNLELARGRLNLGSLRLIFLEGDVLAEAAVEFAPPKTRRLSLDAQASGVDLSGLGALQLAGSSDISGNLRLGLDMGEKVFTAAANLTQIGRSTLQALLVAMDSKESNPGVQELRRFLNRYQVSPRRVSMDIRHGLLSMEVVLDMGFTARAAARLIHGFQGDTFKLKHLPVGGLLSKYLGF
jgi:hypothetical protein